MVNVNLVMDGQITSSLKQLPKQQEKLISKFIEEKLADYVEPTRQGTPRGERVGFSLEKYRATLYALTDKSIEEQAKEIGVSYGVLRKWRSEPAFKDLVHRNKVEFRNHLLRYLRHTPMKMLEHARSLLLASLAESQSKQREAINKLVLLMHFNLPDELKKAEASPHDLRRYQLLALDHAIRTLEDREAAIKHRKDLVNLLSGVRDTFK